MVPRSGGGWRRARCVAVGIGLWDIGQDGRLGGGPLLKCRVRPGREFGLAHEELRGSDTGACMTDWWSVGSGIVRAVATFAATGVALWVAVRDGRQRDGERRDQEAAQARLVTFTGISDGRLLITNHCGS